VLIAKDNAQIGKDNAQIGMEDSDARIELDGLPVLGDRLLGVVLISQNDADQIVSPGDALIPLRPIGNHPSRDFQTLAGVAFAHGPPGDIGISHFKNFSGRWREQFVGTFGIATIGACKRVLPVHPQTQPELLLCNCELPRNIPSARDVKKGAEVGGDGFERKPDGWNHDAGEIGLQRNLWPVLSRMRIFDDLIQSVVQPLRRDVGCVAAFRQHPRHAYRRDRNRLLHEGLPQKYGDYRESKNTR
jgi:hypothetical protein